MTFSRPSAGTLAVLFAPLTPESSSHIGASGIHPRRLTCTFSVTSSPRCTRSVEAWEATSSVADARNTP